VEKERQTDREIIGTESQVETKFQSIDRKISLRLISGQWLALQLLRARHQFESGRAK